MALRGLETAWSSLGYIVGGVVVWGGVGFALDAWLSTSPWFTVVGALLGNFAGIYLVYIHLPRPVVKPGPPPTLGVAPGTRR